MYICENCWPIEEHEYLSDWTCARCWWDTLKIDDKFSGKLEYISNKLQELNKKCKEQEIKILKYKLRVRKLIEALDDIKYLVENDMVNEFIDNIISIDNLFSKIRTNAYTRNDK